MSRWRGLVEETACLTCLFPPSYQEAAADDDGEEK